MGKARFAIVRQERLETQHSEVDRLADEDLFFVGSDERTISSKSDWNSRVPIVGVDKDVAPDGAQSVKPSAQVSLIS